MNIKSFVLASVCLVTGTSFWFFFKDILAFDNFEAFPIWFALVFLTLFLIAFSLLLLFMEHRAFIGGIFFLSMASLLYFFGYNLPILVSVGIAEIAALRAHVRIHKEAESRINFRIPALLREGLPLVLTTLTLLLAVAYYIEMHHAPQRFAIQDILPRTVFERVLLYTPTFSENILPHFDPDMTIDEYTTHTLENNGINIAELSPAERRRVLGETQKQLFKKDTIDGSTRLSELLYDIITKRSEEFIAPYKRFVPLGFAIAFFLFLRSVAFPFGWIIIWVCAGLVKLCIAKGIIIRTEEPTVKEQLAWR